ncbi:MAG: acyl-CoA dehydrogenase family protein [Gammaproteobacteria bacterium]
MSAFFTDSQKLIRDTAARYARDSLAPAAAKVEAAGGGDLYVAHLRELAALGFNGLCVSEKYGGADAGAVAGALAMYEIGKGCCSTAVAMGINNMVAEILQNCGGAAREKFLPPLLSGEVAAAGFCLTESSAGSDPAAMKTSAVADGDSFVLSGTKQWITSGEIAGFYVVWAVTDSRAKKGRGVGCFVAARDTPGISVGPAARKMGQRASPSNDIVFDGARVPKENLLGELRDGFRIAMSGLAGGRIGIAAMSLGVADAALSAARKYMTEREQHGKKLAEHQGLQWMLAERATESEAAFWLTMRAAQLKEGGLPYRKESAMAKLFATAAAERITRDALQIFGGYGYMRALPMERFCRDVRLASIYEGSSEVLKIIVARELLRESAA